jgi:hypothetical protein
MKWRGLAFLMVVILLTAFGYLWYINGPKRVAQRWLTCGADKKSLVTKSDRDYWDEAKAQAGENKLDIFREACLVNGSIEQSSVNGRSAIVKVKYRSPILSWEEMTKFPATAARAEKVRLVRERAAKKKIAEGASDLRLRFESLSWRISLDLEGDVLIRRQMIAAEKYRKHNDYAQAVKIYEKLLESDSLTKEWRKQVSDDRISALAEKACIAAARRYLKFPDAADYDMNGLSVIAKNGKVPVHGDIQAPNAFGVKGHFSTSCDVTFSADKPGVRVKLFMFKPDDPLSLISEDNIEVDI